MPRNSPGSFGPRRVASIEEILATRHVQSVELNPDPPPRPARRHPAWRHSELLRPYGQTSAGGHTWILDAAGDVLREEAPDCSDGCCSVEVAQCWSCQVERPFYSALDERCPSAPQDPDVLDYLGK